VSRFEEVPVARLRPIRVLLVGRDRRFLRTVAVLLGRRGCEVTAIERPADLLGTVALQRPNVVLLDGSDSISATAKAAAALDALPAPVSSLIVYEGLRQEPLRQLRLLPKWGAFDAIASEVERLYRRCPSGQEAGEPALS
jgi:hypothetical protein